jgi:hypothetical protein
MSLEVLYLALMLLGSSACFERAQISPAFGFRVEFSGVQPIFARAEFSYHISHQSASLRKSCIG